MIKFNKFVIPVINTWYEKEIDPNTSRLVINVVSMVADGCVNVSFDGINVHTMIGPFGKRPMQLELFNPSSYRVFVKCDVVADVEIITEV
jgi:hypothetical protein